MLKKKSKTITSILMALIFCAFMTACAPTASTANTDVSQAATSKQAAEETSSSPAASVAASGKTFEVGFAQATVNTPFQNTLQLSAIAAAKDMGINLEVQEAAEDSNKQATQIENFISQKKDLIIVNPCNSDAIVPIIKKANEAGIPVMAVNRPVGKGCDIVSFVGCDDQTGGRVQGEMLKDLLGDKGNVILCQGTLGSSPQVLRQKGLEDYLKENAPGIKIVAAAQTDWDKSKTITFVQNCLAKYQAGEIDAIVNQGPYDSIAALQAVQGSNRNELVGKLIAFDYPKDLQTEIEKGTIYGTVGQDPKEEGATAVKMASLWLNGKKDEVKKEVWVSIPKITKKTLIPATW